MSKKTKDVKRISLSEDQLAEILARLERGSLSDLSDKEMVGLTDRLVKNEEIDALIRLEPIAVGKAQRKAVKRSLFRLKQRGVAVPSMGSPLGSLGTAEDPEDLPVLFHEPFKDAGRLVIGCVKAKLATVTVQIQFSEPDGLSEIKIDRTTPAGFRKLVKHTTKMASVTGESTLHRADHRFLQRKLWEISQCMEHGRINPTVDEKRLKWLVYPTEKPPHPVRELDLDEIEALSASEAGKNPRLAGPFAIEPLWKKLQAAMDEAQKLEESAQMDWVHEKHREAITDWVKEWDPVSMTELFLDLALYYHLCGDQPIAKMYRQVVDHPEISERKAAVTELIVGLFA